MFRKIIYLGLVCISSSLYAHELSSFDEITQVLKQGQDIKVIIDTNQCNVNDPNQYKIPRQTIVTKPTTVIFTDDLVSFAGTKYTHGRAPLPSSGFLQRGSFLLNKAGDLSSVIAFFNAETNRKSDDWKDISISCHLGDGLKIYTA